MTWLSNGLSGVIGAVLALLGSEYFRQHGANKKQAYKIRQKLQGHVLYLRQTLNKMNYALIQFEFYKQRDLIYQRNVNSAELAMSLPGSARTGAENQLRRSQQKQIDNDKQAEFWRQEHTQNQDRAILAIRDLHIDLVEVTQRFYRNKKLINLCNKLMKKDPPQATPLGENTIHQMNDIEEWLQSETERMQKLIDNEWVNKILDLIKIVDEDNKNPLLKDFNKCKARFSNSKVLAIIKKLQSGYK